LPLVALYAFAEEKVAPSPSVLQIAEGSSETAEQALPLVEYKTHQKWGKDYRDYYIVNLPKGVWIEQGDKSFIEEQYFRWSFDNTQGKSHTVMMLNGKTFDQNSLPQLSNAALKKIEISLKNLKKEGKIQNQIKILICLEEKEKTVKQKEIILNLLKIIR
jgi:hypothetical protein